MYSIQKYRCTWGYYMSVWKIIGNEISQKYKREKEIAERTVLGEGERM